MTRVVITGVGLTTALGTTRDASWEAMIEGRCGVRPVTVFDTEGFRSRVAAEVDMTGVDAGMTPLERRRRSRGDRLAVHASSEAVADAGFMDAAYDPSRVGVFLGAGTGDLLRNEDYYRTWITSGLRRARPSDAWNHFLSTPVDAVAAVFGFEGPRGCIVAACSSSTIAIGRAAEAIRAGRADLALAGGADALARLTFSGFNQLRLMDTEPCRPFDRSRAGMNIGEGAGILVLEEYEHARRRGANIYAELAGQGVACEAYHPTAPEPNGVPVAAVIDLALREARLSADSIDHINAHGTATPQNDAAEARGFGRVLGSRVRHVPITSVKSMVGHCLGAAGGVEAAVLALSMARGVIPPTIHHTAADDGAEVDVVANSARETRLRCAVSTSLGFGGNDSAIVMRAV